MSAALVREIGGGRSEAEETPIGEKSAEGSYLCSSILILCNMDFL
jgi:hypothetical protein